jgi:hypothetical protein
MSINIYILKKEPTATEPSGNYKYYKQNRQESLKQ